MALSKEVLEQLDDILTVFAKDTIAGMVRTIKNKNKVATGNLIRSFGYKVVTTLKDISVEIDFDDYGEFVDEGRKPGKQPPVSAIAKWCQVKGIPTSAAFPIAKAIGKKGIKGIHFTKFYNKNVKKLSKKLGENFDDFIVEEIEKIIKNNK